MALPNDPVAWPAAMDPAEVLDFIIDLGAMLEPAEVVDQFELALYPEAAALGLSICADAHRAPALIESDRAVRLWFAVEDERQTDPAFEGSGTQVGVELNVVTNSIPARRRERTFVLTLRQR